MHFFKMKCLFPLCLPPMEDNSTRHPVSFFVFQSAAAAPSPVMGGMPPGDGMPGGPMPPGFFQVSPLKPRRLPPISPFYC